MTLKHNYGYFSGVGFGIAGNGFGLGEEADLKALKHQICTTLN